ncbi:GATA transcription factor 16-like [Cornus florida]|uniref:GATA transcription factor 16-like n=1 Tax=Cornus florida TaxID=4283 RepID=UPI0028989E3B|nr:GATA transcription factor 16-like [Cornus florida]
MEVLDQSQKESLAVETNEIKKCCGDCKTTKTPLWRSGPAGPKSLCNACGIKYRKKRNAGLGVTKGSEKRKEKPTTTATATTTTTSAKASSGSAKGGKLRETLRVRLMSFGKEVVMLQRPRSPMKRQSSRKLGEEEEAAVLLMALSCGQVVA